MFAFKYDKDFYYIGKVNCQIDELKTKQSGEVVYLLPANSTFSEPPKEKDGYKIKLVDNSWEYEKIPDPPPPPPEPSETEKRIEELKSFLAAADYWGQKYIDGEYTEDEWNEKKAQRKAWREEIRQLEGN